MINHLLSNHHYLPTEKVLKPLKIQDFRLHTYQVQVVSWYDNENSYTSQMVRTIKYFAEL